MSTQIEMSMPSYIIYRDSPVGAPFDATAPLAFHPPKDSDELFDAMRTKYPYLKTHSERMREATIEYLIQERSHEQIPEQNLTPSATDASMTPPWPPASFSSVTTGSSSFSSPNMLGGVTPSFSNSPQSQPSQSNFSRQGSVAGTAASSGTTPPALEEMTGVFSLSDSVQPKQRIRRKMTEPEKAEYRKRRIVKACDKCSKRKRKCVHNQPELESTAKPSQRVAKPNPSTSHRRKPAVILNPLPPDLASDKPQATETLVQAMDMFDLNLLQDPLPNISFEELMELDMQKPLKTQQYVNSPWPWSDDPDFTLMHENDHDLYKAFEDIQWDDAPGVQSEMLSNSVQAGGNSLSFTTGNKKHPVGIQPYQHSWGGETGNGALGDDLADAQPRQRSRGGANGNGMLREGLGTDLQAIGNPTSQQTPHQNATRGDALSSDLFVEASAGKPSSCSDEKAPRNELTRNIKNPESIAGSATGATANLDTISSHATALRSASALLIKRGSLQARPRTDSQVSANRANGGVYQRLDASMHSTSNLTGLLPLLPATRVETPARTRAQVATPDNFSGGDSNGQPTSRSSQAEVSGPSAAAHSSRPRAHGSSPATAQGATANHANNATMPLRQPTTTSFSTSDSSCGAYHNVLSDHVRHRDHFGRYLLGIALAVLGCTLLFCASSQNSSIPVSTVLLALLSPAVSAPQKSNRRWQQRRPAACKNGGVSAGSAWNIGKYGLYSHEKIARQEREKYRAVTTPQWWWTGLEPALWR